MNRRAGIRERIRPSEIIGRIAEGKGFASAGYRLDRNKIEIESWSRRPLGL